MKNNLIKTIILTVISMLMSNAVFSQLQKYSIYQITNQYPISKMHDMSFTDYNNGFLCGVKDVKVGNNYDGDESYIFRTTNGGLSFEKVWQKRYALIDLGYKDRIAISFYNTNSGYASKRGMLYKTTNGGTNWAEISISGPTNYDNTIISTKSNGDLFLIRKGLGFVYKYTNAGIFQEIKNFGEGFHVSHIEISKLNENNIYVCGNKYNDEQPNYRPFFAYSTNSGETWITVLDGSSTTYGSGTIDHLSVTNNGFNDVVKLSGDSKLIEFKSGNLEVLTSNWGTYRKVSFGAENFGYYLRYDQGDNPPVYAQINKTTDGGRTWTTDYEINQAGRHFNTVNKFFSKREIVYVTESFPDNYAKFYVRNLNKNLFTYFDNISSFGSMTINSMPYNTPDEKYLRGGNSSLESTPVLNQGSNDERIFYKWSFNSMLNNKNYDIIYEGILANIYKTKNKADNPWAIYYPNQVKALKDLNNTINQIHMSIVLFQNNK